LSILYIIYEKEEKELPIFNLEQSVITVEELPPIRKENK